MLGQEPFVDRSFHLQQFCEWGSSPSPKHTPDSPLLFILEIRKQSRSYMIYKMTPFKSWVFQAAYSILPLGLSIYTSDLVCLKLNLASSIKKKSIPSVLCSTLPLIVSHHLSDKAESILRSQTGSFRLGLSCNFIHIFILYILIGCLLCAKCSSRL